MQSMENIFADNAMQLRDSGLAVMPIDRLKKPVLMNFNKWSAIPSKDQFLNWTRKYPTHNIGILPRLSKLVIVDVDDIDLLPEAIRYFGDTPVKTRTSRGVHLWYRVGRDCDEYPGTKHLQKTHGLAIDIIARSGYVVAPPSVHESGYVYLFAEGGLKDLNRLPAFKLDAVSSLPRPQTKAVKRPTERNPASKLSQYECENVSGNGSSLICEGGRWNYLRCQLIESVRSGRSSIDALRACAVGAQTKFEMPLSDKEVSTLVDDTLERLTSGKLRSYLVGQKSDVLKVNCDEFYCIVSASGGGPLAYYMLSYLRCMHRRRTKFFVSQDKIWNSAKFSKFGRDSVAQALRSLVRHDALTIVKRHHFNKDAGVGRATEYEFASLKVDNERSGCRLIELNTLEYDGFAKYGRKGLDAHALVLLIRQAFKPEWENGLSIELRPEEIRAKLNLCSSVWTNGRIDRALKFALKHGIFVEQMRWPSVVSRNRGRPPKRYTIVKAPINIEPHGTAFKTLKSGINQRQQIAHTTPRFIV
jgi:hypothetical protein